MRLLLAILLLLAFVAAAPAQSPPAFDLVIAGGRVIDPESGLDAVRHVGIKAGKIVMLSEAPLMAASTLDAAGLVVATRLHRPAFTRADDPFDAHAGL
jgi:hypothetical protein